MKVVLLKLWYNYAVFRIKNFSLFDGTQQVTAGKGDLEKSLKLAKKLKKETAALEELIVAIDETLTEQETKKGPIDHEDQLRTLAVSYSSSCFMCVVHGSLV